MGLKGVSKETCLTVKNQIQAELFVLLGHRRLLEQSEAVFQKVWTKSIAENPESAEK